MELIVCAVHDRATEAYARPFYVSRPGEAIRSFGDEVGRKPGEGQQNNLYSHPTDYELWQLAVWDDQTGTFVTARQRLARAEDFALTQAK